MSTIGNTTTGAPGAGGNGQEASTAGQAKQKVQETTQQAAGQARGRLREQVDQRSTQAGQQLNTTADDVRSVAQQLREQGKDQPAKLAEQAAERTQRVGEYLQRADGDTILSDAEDFGRRQPWAVMAGGLALGFAASRFLKASSSRRYENRGTTSRELPAQGRDLGSAPSGPSVGTGALGTGGSSVIPPATSVPPATAAPAPERPLTPSPEPGRPAEDVSLSGGVTPPSTPRPERGL